jgi:hypothetical protein
MNKQRALVYTLILLVILAAGWLGWRGWRTATYARLALADLRRLEATARDLSPAALPTVRQDLAALDQHLTATRSAARPFLWAASRFGWLPRIGATVQAAPALVDLAVELIGGGRATLDALTPVTDLLAQRGEGDLLARAAPALAQAAPRLAEADVRLARAEALRAGIGRPLHPQAESLMARLDRYLPLAIAAVRGAQAAPALLGADEPRSYLILAQNNHELRGAGGFISGVGVVRLDAGQIVDLKLSDSYAVDNLKQPHPRPPAALAEQVGAQMLLLRDSNWSPDFPTSAEVARALFQQDQGVATDGAIALDLEAVRLLVAALEPLSVPGMAGPVTGANVISQMKQAWTAPATTQATVQEASSSDWWRRRKDFMGELVAAALARLQGGGELNPTALANALLTMLDRRHLQIAVDDPTVAALLAERGWDGGLRPPAGADFLAVVDSNLGYNKVNAAVQQAIAYRVEPDGRAPGALIATLILTYTHTAAALPADQPCDRTPRYGDSYDEMIRRCYWDYLRVYAPADSELLASEGLNRPQTERGERGATVFSGDFVLRPASRHVVILRYRLPQTVSAAPYRLLARKQAGTLAPALRVEAGACSWRTDLGQDRSLTCAAP